MVKAVGMLDNDTMVRIGCWCNVSIIMIQERDRVMPKVGCVKLLFCLRREEDEWLGGILTALSSSFVRKT